jgi:hypothetical protein
MLVIDAMQPQPGEVIAQQLRFADPRPVRLPLDVRDQSVDPPGGSLWL